MLAKQLSKENKETTKGNKKLIAMLINKVIVYSGGKIQIVFNVLNDSQPVIRESWRQALNDAVHQPGELPKWLKGLVLKTGRGFIAPLGFESLILRQTRN